MISRELLKAEIDKVKTEHLDLLYSIIKLMTAGISTDGASTPLDWHEFVASTYGCLSDASIE